MIEKIDEQISTVEKQFATLQDEQRRLRQSLGDTEKELLRLQGEARALNRLKAEMTKPM